MTNFMCALSLLTVSSIWAQSNPKTLADEKIIKQDQAVELPSIASSVIPIEKESVVPTENKPGRTSSAQSLGAEQQVVNSLDSEKKATDKSATDKFDKSAGTRVVDMAGEQPLAVSPSIRPQTSDLDTASPLPATGNVAETRLPQSPPSNGKGQVKAPPHTLLVKDAANDTTIFKKTDFKFQVLTPPNKSVLFSDSMVLAGHAPAFHDINVRGYVTQVDSSGNWEMKLPTPRGEGRYSFMVLLTRDAKVVDQLQWKIEKANPELAYSMDSLVQIQDAQRELHNKGSLGDIIYFIPQTNDVSLISLNSWRNSQILNMLNSRVKYVHPDDLIVPRALQSQRECKQVYCAGILGGFNRVPYAVLGKVIESPKNYLVELSLLNTRSQEVEKIFRRKVVHNKFLALEALDEVGLDVRNYIESVIAAKVAAPEDLLAIAEKQKVEQRKREIDAILGTHIIGTDLPDTIYADRSPYVIANTMVVPAGKTTVIEKGTTFLIYGQNTEIQVFGQIRVEGSSRHPVKFFSHRSKPIQGDWSGFVIQSPYTSVFDYVEIEHARDGISAINSSLEVNNSLIMRNLNFGIYAQNSDVLIRNSQIRGDHESGIFAESYSVVKIDDSKITANHNGITIGDFGAIEVRNSEITKNDYGVALMDSVSVFFAGTRVRDNRIGLASTSHFKSLTDKYGNKSFSVTDYSGVRSNVDNFVHLNREQLQQLTQNFIRKDTRTLLVTDSQRKNFKGNLTLVDSEQSQYEFNHMGSVTAGLGFHAVDQPFNTSPRVHDLGNTKVLPGRKYPNDKQVQGIQATTSVFTLTDLDSHSLEFNMDVSYDDSVGLFSLPLTLRYNSPQRSIVLGDMNESSHELILSSRDILGAKLEEYSMPNQSGDPLWKMMGLWGETQRPLDEGEHNPQAFFDEILPGNARPQEILTMGVVSHQYTPTLRIDGGIVHSKEERSDLMMWRDDLRLKSELGEPQIQAQSIFTEWDYNSPKQMFRLNVAVIHASSDSLEVARLMAIDRFLEEYNIIEQADSLRAALKELPSPNPARVSDHLPTEYPANAYEVISKVSESEVAIRDSLADLTYYGFRKSAQSWGGQTLMEFNFGKTNLSAKAQFMGQSFYSAGSPNLNQNSRTYELNWNQGMTQWWESSLAYGAYVENASSSDSHMNLLGYGEGSLLGLQSDQSEKSSLDQDRIQPRYIQDLTTTQMFYLPQGFDLEVGYHYQQNAQRTNRVLEKDTTLNTGVFLDDFFDGSGRTLEHFGNDVDVSESRWEDYLALPDTIATGFQNLWTQNEIISHLRWKYDRRSSIRAGFIYGWQADASSFKYTEAVSSYQFADSTWDKLGYYYNGENYTQFTVPVTWSTHFSFIKNRLSLKYFQKSFIENNETQEEISIRNSASFEVIPTKLSMTLDLGIRNKKIEIDQAAYYFVDMAGDSEEKLRYLANVSSVDSVEVGRPIAEDQLGAVDVSSTSVASDEYELRKEDSKDLREEIDLSYGTTIKYNINTRFYTEYFFRYDEFGRPQDLNEEFTDLHTGIRLSYSF